MGILREINMAWMTINEREKYGALLTELNALVTSLGHRHFNIGFGALCDIVQAAKYSTKLNNGLVKAGDFESDIITQFDYLDESKGQLVTAVFRPGKGRNTRYWFIVEYLRANYCTRQCAKAVLAKYKLT